MPRRKSVVTVQATEVQGEDSYVILSRPTVKEIRAISNMPEDTDQLVEGIKLLAPHIKEWNWVDDDGDPLPLPTGDDAMDLLTISELNFLLNSLISGSEEEEKN